MSKMENTKPTFKTHFCDHENGTYSVTLEFTNRHIGLTSAGYHPYVSVDIYTLTPEDMLEIAESIRKIAIQLKPELNESLMAGAGI